MSVKCEDCGCVKRNGICTNCNEELYIFDYQNEHLPENLSDEFLNKVKEQRENI